VDEWGCAIDKSNGVENGMSKQSWKQATIGPIVMLPLL
jgi:hypothetical protein